MSDAVNTEQSEFVLPFEPTRAAVAVWLVELPILNTVQSGDKVYRSLELLRKQEIAASELFEILQLLRPTARLLSDSLEKFFIDAAFPLPRKEQKLAKLSTCLHRELALCYEHLLKKVRTEDNSILSLEQRIAAIESLFSSLLQEQFLIALRYEGCSKRFWNTFTTASLSYEELSQRTSDDSSLANTSTMINRVLLFSLASPNRFTQREIREMFRVMENFADLAYIDKNPLDSASKKSGFFYVVGSAKAPEHTSRLPENQQDVRYIHTREMAKYLTDHFRELLDFNKGTVLVSSKKMLEKLIRSLGAPERRKTPRHHADSEECSIIPGINNIITHLKGDETDNKKSGAAKPIKPRPASEVWNDVPDFGIIPLDNAGSDYLTRNNQRDEILAFNKLSESKKKVSANDIWGKKRAINPASFSSSNDTEIEIPCRILNTSKQGIKLLWTNEQKTKIKVGEVISIGNPDSSVETGVIRWIEQSEDDGLSFGIELLSHDTRIVTAYSPDQPDSKTEGLLIPDQPDGDIHQSILLSPSKYRTGAWIELENGKEKHAYRLQKLQDMSPSFNQFTLFDLDNST